MRNYSRAIQLREQRWKSTIDRQSVTIQTELKNLVALAGNKYEARQYASAIRSWRVCRPRFEQVFANDKRSLTSFWTPMSYYLELSGRLDEALAIYEQCYAMGTGT